MKRDAALAAELAAALAAMPDGWRPRTRHLEQGRPRFVNRLIFESSAYLRQHAVNPVDWQAWGETALSEARRRGLPIFLSVGYATCHWCHVMEEESFDDLDVAAVLNARFVPVKLDREERPELDHIYITATSLQQGHAGWPNSCFLTPDGLPFHTGTYFPKPAFLQLLHAVERAWVQERAKLESFATQFAGTVRSLVSARSEAASLADAASLAVTQLSRAFNSEHGGFSRGTQFAHPAYLLFLLDHWRRTGEDAALDMVLATLAAMDRGGLHDQAGGGFHRYATDVAWRLPHFEKMLYDQALLIRCYREAWQISGDESLARVVERSVAYLLRDLTLADGCLASAEDADSPDRAGESAEGAFYLWDAAEARTLIGEDDARHLGLDRPPDIEGQHVLSRPDGFAPETALERLRRAREDRPRPFRDDKVILGWNALAVRALAEAASAFGRPDWRVAAERTADALVARMSAGGVYARVHDGAKAHGSANLSDLASLGLALQSLGRREASAGLVAPVLAFGQADGRLALSLDSPLGPVLEGEDGVMPAGESAALEFLRRELLNRDDAALEARVLRLEAALSGGLSSMPVARLDALAATRLSEGESGYRRMLGQGAVTLLLGRDKGGFVLRIEIAEGWHLSADAVLQGAEAQWPDRVAVTGGLGWTGTLELKLKPAGSGIALRLQACSGAMCLLPETARFRVRM